MTSIKNYLLFCHKPYGFPLRGIFVSEDSIPEENKKDFDKIYNSKENQEISDNSLKNICNFWKLLADNSPSSDEILFGSDNEIPKWVEDSLPYYQNEWSNRNDMSIGSHFALYEKLKSIKQFKRKDVNVTKSILLYEYKHETIKNVLGSALCK